MLALNNTGVDAKFINFTKGNTNVGSIGSEGGDSLYIGTGDTGIKFSAADIIQPFNPSTNASRDTGIDLGSSGARFKDLYLSGGVVLDDNPTAVSGSVTSKTLDDYEEGSFTMSVIAGGHTLVDQSGFYTKIGRKVTVVGSVTFDPIGANTSSVTLGGLPFTAGNLDADISYVGVARETIVAGDIFVAQVARATTTFGINSMDGVANGSNQIFVANRTIVFNVTYFV